jgi:hypothetical protein
MTLIPQLSQKPNARAKTSRRTLADGPASWDDLVTTRRDQAGACGIPVLRSWETRLFLPVMTGHSPSGSRPR